MGVRLCYMLLVLGVLLL